MNTSKSILLVICAALALSSMSLVGCGGGGDKAVGQMKDANKAHIRRLRNCYSMYMQSHSYQGPKDEAELMNYLKTDENAAKKLERMGIPMEELDDMLVSERDGEPFKVRWGLSGLEDHAIVFESVGVEGKYMVCFATPRELEKDEYDDYWTGKLQGEGPGGAAETMSDDVINDMKQDSDQ